MISPLPELCFGLLLLTPLMLAGFTLIHIGFGRARGAAYAGLSSLVVIAIATLTFWAFGHPATLAVSHWMRHESVANARPSALLELFEVYAVSFTALIPLGAAADRWKLRSLCLSTVLLAGISFPVFTHWSWEGGWLGSTAFFHGGALFDPAGGASIHLLGALTALSIAWIVGPRRKKYPVDGPPAAIPGHNIAYVLAGCLLLSPGWIALNCAGTALYGFSTATLIAVALNTQLCAATALLSALVTTRVRYIKPDASLCANGWVAGLVASSGVCCVASPWFAILTGLIVGWLVIVCAEWLEILARIDDPGGVIPVHGVAGILGVLLAGVFPRLTRPGFPSTWSFHQNLVPQIVGIATLVGLVFPLTYVLNWVLDYFDHQRVEPAQERKGMDLQELGGIAYPEFSLQPDD